MIPAFDTPVPAGGYRWWYLDGFSDDGHYGITLIAFIGSVFSPYYARARRRAGGPADPMAHCALNVVLYAIGSASGPRRWAMTERTGSQVQRSGTQLQIGPSALRWDGSGLQLQLDEITAPWPQRVRGVVRVEAEAWLGQPYALDAGGMHHWQPVAPVARIDVDLQHPRLRWSGHAYLDANFGARALEQDFAGWDWSRTALSGGRCAVLYDVTTAQGGHSALALQMDRQGRVSAFPPPPTVALPGTGWGLARGTRSEPGAAAPRVAQTLEDGPFYARSLLQTRLLGESATAVHESLSLRRFSAPWVQALLPFRMPRRRA